MKCLISEDQIPEYKKEIKALLQNLLYLNIYYIPFLFLFKGNKNYSGNIY